MWISKEWIKEQIKIMFEHCHRQELRLSERITRLSEFVHQVNDKCEQHDNKFKQPDTIFVRSDSIAFIDLQHEGYKVDEDYLQLYPNSTVIRLVRNA